MKTLLIIFLAGFASIAFGQTETFDIASYTPPRGWVREDKPAFRSFTKTDNVKRTWTRIIIYKSTTTNGSVEQDFNADWQELIATPYVIKDAARSTTLTESGGWKIKSGSGKFNFDGQECAANLTTSTGFGRCLSIAFQMNSDQHLAIIQDFMASLKFNANESSPSNVQTSTSQQKSIPSPPTQNTKVTSSSTTKITSVPATFTTTNFDNGWTSVAREDWVETSKGNIRVLIHYPTDKIDMSSMDYQVIGRNAWNTLVAPRYSNKENFFQLSGNMSFEPAYFFSSTLTDNATGKKVFVVLFHKTRSSWTEVISPDKDTFTQEFGIDKVDAYFNGWEPLEKLSTYNRFAVAASDLKGKWTTSFTGIQQYYNVYTGADAGATSYSSSQSYDFTGSTFKYNINVASGPVGNAKFQGAKSNGSFKLLNNWQVSFSDIEGKPKTYDAYFSFVKGARILWFSDITYPGYTSFFKAE